jgi:ubiquinone/menaquinone biosynthesis C-methylase UbiE
MSYPTEPPKEHPSAYFVEDRSSQDEMTRLEIQDRMLTTGMGGALPELVDPTQLSHVLDVGCGTGGWLMEVAKTYPTIERLVGADISSKMMEHARAQAKAQDLDERVQFKTMDALRILQFPASSFDLVNQRAGTSWLRTWEWKKILLEYQRVTRPGGIIRITDSNLKIETNSPALTKLNSIGLASWHNSGRFFTPNGNDLADEFVRLMAQHAVENVQVQFHPLTYRGGTVECQQFCDDMAIGFRLGLPFFQKWTRIPSDYQQICQQAVREMRQPDFVATWTWFTAWGTKPYYGEPLLMRGLN